MRLVLAVVLAGLAALPLSVSAQASDKERLEDFYPGTLPESPQEFDKERLEDFCPEPARSSEPAGKEPALELKLDAAGVDVTPSPPRTVDGYTLEEMELRVKRAKIGLGVSGGVLLAGAVMGAIALSQASPLFCFIDCPSPPEWVAPVGWTGLALWTTGLAGMIISGILKRRRERDRDMLQEAHYGTPRRVQWDLAQSRLVF